MSYPREKRKTNHPILRYGFMARPVTWASKEQAPPDTIMKRGNKWIVIRNKRIVFKGTLAECRKF